MAQDGTSWILYGANGYTGTLIAEESARRWMRPVLAGRRPEPVKALGERIGLEWRSFPIEDPGAIAREIGGFRAVLLAAGPFSATSGPVLEACLRAGCHYIDITGEILVFEACRRRDREARERGITVLPGAGFDVVPSDCLAAALKKALPGATRLELAIHSDGALSRGTAKTILEGFSLGGAVREGGKIRRVPLAWKTALIPFRDGRRPAVSIPWGDVSTAHHSTGIPDIVVYAAAPMSLIRRLRLMRYLVRFLRVGLVQKLIRRAIDRKVTGPSAEDRRRGSAQLWGRASTPGGEEVEGTLVTPEGYDLTARTALVTTLRVLAGKAPAGFTTPAAAFGPEFIGEFEGCDLRIGEVRKAAAPAARA